MIGIAGKDYETVYQNAKLSSCGRRSINRYVGYEELANAVVFQAVRDLEDAICDLHENGYDKKARDIFDECEYFFRSAWCTMLTKIDGEWLMKLAEEQMKKRGYKRFENGQLRYNPKH